MRSAWMVLGLGSMLGCGANVSTATPPKSAFHAPMTPIGVDYQVAEDAKVRISGHSDVGDDWMSGMHRKAAKGGDRDDLELRAEPTDDGRFAIAVRYREENDTSGSLSWSPVIVAKRGEKSTVQLACASGVRSISLTVR